MQNVKKKSKPKLNIMLPVLAHKKIRCNMHYLHHIFNKLKSTDITIYKYASSKSNQMYQVT